MKERIMTEKGAAEHEERIREMRGKKGGKASARALRKKTRHRKAVDPDKTQEYETRLDYMWVVIKGLESRIIQLESKEGRTK